MLRLDKVIKPWKESAALNAHINLYGFWNETTSSVVRQVRNWWYIWALRQPDQMRYVPVRFEGFYHALDAVRISLILLNNPMNGCHCTGKFSLCRVSHACPIFLSSRLLANPGQVALSDFLPASEHHEIEVQEARIRSRYAGFLITSGHVIKG